MTKKNKETFEIFNQAVKDIKPFMSISYDFENIEAYLTVFDEIPFREKEFLIEYFVRMIWSYSDYKIKSVQKKSISKIEKAINNYQEVIRGLHNNEASDEVIYRNGVTYTYNGENDFDEDFDIELDLYNLSSALKSNYLVNIETLKEIQDFKERLQYLDGLATLYGTKKTSIDFRTGFFENCINEFKIINPLDFIETYRPSKKHLKNILYDAADKYNLRKYEIKQLIDSI